MTTLLAVAVELLERGVPNPAAVRTVFKRLLKPGVVKPSLVVPPLSQREPEEG